MFFHFNRGLSHGYLLLSAEPRQGDAGGELYVQALKQVPTIPVVKKMGAWRIIPVSK